MNALDATLPPRPFAECREELWRQLSDPIREAAQFQEPTVSPAVVARCGGWMLALDKYVVPVRSSEILYTRLRATCYRHDGFRFRIYRKTLLSIVGIWLGMQDVQIGEAAFDEQFVIQGNNPDKILALLSNTTLREQLAGQSGVQLALSEDESWAEAHAPACEALLCLETSDSLLDAGELRAFYDLFADTLCQLERIASKPSE